MQRVIGEKEKVGRVTAVRCVWCGARMFDSDGCEVEPEAAHVEVDIVCGRCKGVNVVNLAYRREPANKLAG